MRGRIKLSQYDAICREMKKQIIFEFTCCFVVIQIPFCVLSCCSCCGCLLSICLRCLWISRLLLIKSRTMIKTTSLATKYSWARWFWAWKIQPHFTDLESFYISVCSAINLLMMYSWFLSCFIYDRLAFSVTDCYSDWNQAKWMGREKEDMSADCSTADQIDPPHFEIVSQIFRDTVRTEVTKTEWKTMQLQTIYKTCVGISPIFYFDWHVKWKEQLPS